MRGTWAAGRVAALTADHGCKGLSPSGQARHHSCLADGTHGHSITASARSERHGPRQAECLSHLPERPCLLSRAARRGSERPRLDVYRSKVLPPVAVHPCCGLPSSSWIRTALTIVTSEAHEPGCERCQNGSIAVRHLRRSPSMREAVAASSAFMKTRSWSIFSSQAMRVAALDLKRIIEPCISHDVMRRLHPAKPATRPDARVGTR